MDKSVRPQDDFYNYVNGGWMKTAVIPSDKPSWGSFNALREDVDVASLDILNKILSEKFSLNLKAKKFRHFTELPFSSIGQEKCRRHQTYQISIS